VITFQDLARHIHHEGWYLAGDAEEWFSVSGSTCRIVGRVIDSRATWFSGIKYLFAPKGGTGAIWIDQDRFIPFPHPGQNTQKRRLQAQ
jgi:hypothetical protein